ncbi:hypothetical protein C8F04DRAFT_1273792 [Mycena alexandri]|uniref:F-box domain-containing protein n=1 Tax=Mycena alexandri TaxID=1745969 RepID=A0AAD6S681_9AGAR|nr:hypothetical protein C8F04DRAFT_1273792 [Mycena alexandri]
MSGATLRLQQKPLLFIDILVLHLNIVDQITTLCPKDCLRTLATVSRTWTHPAQKWLFRDIELHDVSRLMGLFSSKHLHRMIRRLTLTVSSDLLVQVHCMDLVNLTSCAIIGSVDTPELVGLSSSAGSLFDLHSTRITHLDLIDVLFEGIESTSTTTPYPHLQNLLTFLTISDISVAWTREIQFPFLLCGLETVRLTQSTDNLPFDLLTLEQLPNQISFQLFRNSMQLVTFTSISIPKGFCHL